MNEQQGIQLSLEELYQVIGEKEVLRFKLVEENKRLKALVDSLTEELKVAKNG